MSEQGRTFRNNETVSDQIALHLRFGVEADAFFGVDVAFDGAVEPDLDV